MYKRDFGILALAAFAVYFTLQNEGPFEFRKAWYYPIAKGRTIETSSNNEVLPKPVVVDLNGDGSLEIVAVTHEYNLIVMRGRKVGKEGDGFVVANRLSAVSLRPDSFHSLYGQRPVALVAGHIDEPSKDAVHRHRKAVIVTMNENWHLTCFDHNLNQMWSKDVRGDMHVHARIDEVALLITHHKVYDHDRGLIVVGGSINIASAMEENLETEEDPFETEQDLETKEEKIAKKLGEGDKSMEIEEGQVGGADVSRNFVYYAFDGGSGELRWKHEASKFDKDLESLKEDFSPLYDFQLTAERVNSRDYSQVTCRDYKESILHNLPHQWTHPVDTRFDLSHFDKHKLGKGERRKDLAKEKKSTPSSLCIGKSCKKDAVSKVIGDVSKRAGRDGRPVIEESKPPNAIVAHLREGIEAIHLYSGRAICKLYLQEGGLHADLNGDGVLDHMRGVSGYESEAAPTIGHDRLPPCQAFATSGIPPNERFFNGSICKQTLPYAFSNAKVFSDFKPSFKSLKVAPPAMLPIPTPRGEHRFRYGQRGNALFLNNRGDLAAFSSRGKQMWIISTSCSWYNSPSSLLPSQPTLKPFPLRTHALPTAILIAGDRFAEVVSEHGNVLATIPLPDRPVIPLEIVDLNGDGLNDILLVSNRVIYAYIQVQNLTGKPFSMLVLCLIAAMAIIYAAQYTTHERTKPIKRSTDRTD